jgi:hypothetical protein
MIKAFVELPLLVMLITQVLPSHQPHG